MSVIDDIANAITNMEGKPGSINYRNNNPGNLRSGVGQVGSNGGYAVFASWTDGMNALKNQISLNISRGLTLTEFFGGKPGVYAGYAPSGDSNDPLNYAKYVSGQTGIPINVPLDNVAGKLPSGGSDVSNNAFLDISRGDSVNNGGNVSSESVVDSIGVDFASLSLFDVNGNFNLSPLAVVVGAAVIGILVYGLR